MIVSGIICPTCKEPIWSRHRHDFRHCFCKDTFVDGGRDYLRYGGPGNPEVVKIDTELDEVIE